MWDFIILFLPLLFFLLIRPKSIKKTSSKSLAPFGYTLFYTDQNTKKEKT